MYMGKFLINKVIDTQSIRQNVILSCESIFIVTRGDLNLVITFLSIIPASLVYIYLCFLCKCDDRHFQQVRLELYTYLDTKYLNERVNYQHRVCFCC